MRATCVHELAVSFLVAFEVVFELELVVFLLVVAEAIFSRQFALSITRCPDQHLGNILLVFGRRVSYVDAQFAKGQGPVHVVNLPVALERVDQTLGILADKSTRFRLTDDLKLEKVRERRVVTDVLDSSIRKVIVAASATAHS